MRPKKNWLEDKFLHFWDPGPNLIRGDGPDELLAYSDSGMPFSRSMAQRKERELTSIANNLKEFFSRNSMTDGEKLECLTAITAMVFPPARPFPDKAPALWAEREDRKKNPADFITSVYEQWLGHGLTQAHILHLDKQLYFAFHKWLRSNDMPAGLDLPTRRQVNDRKLQELGVTPENPSVRPDVEPDLRERMRLNRAVHRRFG
jgi:hypothetical protein